MAILVGSDFRRRLCIVNPPDGMLPLNLTIDPMLPVLMLQIIIVQHMRQRSCDEQGFFADTCTKIQTVFHEDARVLLSTSASALRRQPVDTIHCIRPSTCSSSTQAIGMTYLALFWLLVAGLCPC